MTGQRLETLAADPERLFLQQNPGVTASRRMIAGGDRQIELPRLDHLRKIDAEAAAHRNLHLWMPGGKRRKDIGQNAGAIFIGDSDPHHTCHRCLRKGCRHLVQLAQDRLGGLQQGLPGFRQGDASGFTRKERDLQPFFQLPDLDAYCRLGLVKSPRRMGYVAVPRHDDEAAQKLAIELGKRLIVFIHGFYSNYSFVRLLATSDPYGLKTSKPPANRRLKNMSLDLPKRPARPVSLSFKSLAKLGFLLTAVTAALLWPGHAWAAMIFALENLFLILPMIAIGLFLTAGVHASGSMALIAASFRGRPVRMIFLAALIGALTPVCGVSVLPLVAGLLAGGVPLAPIMAFWLSSPITDPGMLAITAGTLGSSFAIGKTLAAFVIGLFGGGAAALLIGAGLFRSPAKASFFRASGRSCDTTEGCTATASAELCWQFWRAADRRKIFLTSCLANGRLMFVWLFAAFLAEYALQLFLPPDFVGRFASGDDWWSVPAAAVVGAPIYLDGYAALPLIRALIDSGMGQGPAMAFLIAGGITSAWAAIPVFALVRLPIFVFYLIMAVLSAILSGWLFGFVVSHF